MDTHKSDTKMFHASRQSVHDSRLDLSLEETGSERMESFVVEFVLGITN